MDDLISRQAAIDAIDKALSRTFIEPCGEMILKDLPSAQPEERTDKRTETHACDCVSRQAAIDYFVTNVGFHDEDGYPIEDSDELRKIWTEYFDGMPSAQPERTCVNCGRTANNGGWYADGRTRCPIEEHYALPKDGYCHLWEKRNVTDDDCPERREE